MEISGKRVLITGASRGLGRALALACLRAGAEEVFAGARSPEAFDSLRSETLTPVKLDITSDADVQAAAQQVGRVDLLINNAGIALYGGVFKSEFSEIQREIDTNLVGAIRVARAFAPAMSAQGDGLIVNVASQLAKVALPAMGIYCVTKSALLALTQAMRGDLAPSGVRVIAVLPGAMDTDMTRAYDIPKTSLEDAAAEILAAIKNEARETVICDDARKLISDLATDPVGVEDALAQMRA